SVGGYKRQDDRRSSLLFRSFVLPFSGLCVPARIEILLFYNVFIGRIKRQFFLFYASMKLIKCEYMSIIG
ncbi:MAG: hypothetical protein D4R45_00600, partial [Planctomycetaceae bacterium]